MYMNQFFMATSDVYLNIFDPYKTIRVCLGKEVVTSQK